MNPLDKTERRAGYGFLAIFIVLAAGIVASGVFFYGNYKTRFRAEVDRQLLAVAELKVNELVDWRAERFGDASLFFKNASFSGLVRRFFERPNDAEARDQLRTWLSHFQAAYEYIRIFLLDAHGVERISVPDTPETVAPHLIQQGPEILRSGKVTFMDFHRDAPDRPIHLSMLVPVLEGGDNSLPMGLLVLRIDPQRYLYPYISRWPTSSRTAETLIVRRDGNDALYLNELRFQKNAALNMRVPLSRKDVPAVQAVLGREGIVEGVDYRGVPVLAVLRSVPGSPWFLVARMDIAEAYAPLRERLWAMIAFFGSLLLVAGAGIGFIWRHQHARVYQEKHVAAEALLAVSRRQEALLSAVPDIIMEVDNNRVYTWANPAGLRFFGEDAIGKEAAFYFEGEQETYQTVQPLFDGSENVIYVESWQRRKDGQTRLLAWWCRVLKDKSERVTGAISSARDITEQTLAQDALREGEERFRTLYENSTLGLYRTTPDGRIILANPALVKMLGYSSFDDLSSRDLKTDGFEPSYPRAQFVDMLEKEGAVRGLESAWKGRDGSTIFVRESARVIRDAEGRAVYYDGTVEDISDRKRAEEALAYEQSLLRALMDNSPDQVYFKDEQSRFVKISKAQAERFGLSDPAQAVGKTDSDFFAADHARPALEDERRVMITGRPLVDLEEMETWPDGRAAWVSTTKVPLRDKSGRVIGTFGISRDITERKRGEERLKETLQRLRLAITSIVRVIGMMVEARDPYTAGHQQRTTVLAEAIAVEMGLSTEKIEGLRMAGHVHDVGKISVPAEILSKPTRLTPGEFKLVKTHAQKGHEILKDVEFPWPLAEIVYQHHERCDGSGYPRGLKGAEILIEARILAVSDTMEAMASNRPYRPAPGLEVALEEIDKNKGVLFDADVAAACLRLFKEKGFRFPD